MIVQINPMNLEQQDECPFCSLPIERIIAETQSFVIIRPLDPIVSAEILLIPRRHVAGIALLSQSERNEADEIWRILFDSVSHLKCGVIFEHGNHSHGPFEPWHKHAHLHILAVPIIISPLCKYLTPIQRQCSYNSCEPFSSEYIFCKDVDNQPEFFILPKALPRQYLRSKMKEQLDLKYTNIGNKGWREAESCLGISIKQIRSLMNASNNPTKEKRK
jgi:diadenosine tetraphosphate (Ap4A) HIT family hydrolase